MSKKLLVAVSLTLIYMLIVGIININFPISDIKFILIGISAMTFLLVSQKINEKLFNTKA
ncbi:hypothetical protein DCE79_05445 [Lysinibacillus sp. 2017]|uniref:hypothetical protein n=1 Tax=unclassified Lysinibacillus TaxID=2636778 RepID=UPI000D5285F9|nr:MULTISPECIES: hypothetical protein [unclassified Lysinibacillus]AWE06876.1 hypothetical protein DCE79_05445 [Lysinibacillus sp. 2017]TGN37193.1 hypothetical protein E4L99_01550 [Lysinibacillus sp. S2017]